MFWLCNQESGVTYNLKDTCFEFLLQIIVISNFPFGAPVIECEVQTESGCYEW